MSSQTINQTLGRVRQYSPQEIEAYRNERLIEAQLERPRKWEKKLKSKESKPDHASH